MYDNSKNLINQSNINFLDSEIYNILNHNKLPIKNNFENYNIYEIKYIFHKIYKIKNDKVKKERTKDNILDFMMFVKGMLLNVIIPREKKLIDNKLKYVNNSNDIINYYKKLSLLQEIELRLDNKIDKSLIIEKGGIKKLIIDDKIFNIETYEEIFEKIKELLKEYNNNDHIEINKNENCINSCFSSNLFIVLVSGFNLMNIIKPETTIMLNFVILLISIILIIISFNNSTKTDLFLSFVSLLISLVSVLYLFKKNKKIKKIE